MQGSEKQISWAEEIKAQMISDIEQWMNPSPVPFVAAKEGDKSEDQRRGKNAIAKLHEITDAKWFIDNREHRNGLSIVDHLLGC